jgi:hypothetical protein
MAGRKPEGVAVPAPRERQEVVRAVLEADFSVPRYVRRAQVNSGGQSSHSHISAELAAFLHSMQWPAVAGAAERDWPRSSRKQARRSA